MQVLIATTYVMYRVGGVALEYYKLTWLVRIRINEYVALHSLFIVRFIQLGFAKRSSSYYKYKSYAMEAIKIYQAIIRGMLSI